MSTLLNPETDIKNDISVHGVNRYHIKIVCVANFNRLILFLLPGGNRCFRFEMNAKKLRKPIRKHIVQVFRIWSWRGVSDRRYYERLKKIKIWVNRSQLRIFRFLQRKLHVHLFLRFSHLNIVLVGNGEYREG